MLQIKHYEMLETFNNEKSNLETPWVAYVEENNTVYYSVDDVIKYRVFLVKQKDISNITYETVDLGLPSGLKWADRNVGATSPEDYGSYFQWGDTDAYTYDGAGEITAAELAKMLNPILSPELGEEITADNVGMILERMGIVGTDLTPMGIGFSLDKFFNWDSYNEVDVITGWEEDGNGYRYPTGFKKYNNNGGLTVLESVDDAAAVHTNSQLRMPTSDEIQELIIHTTQTFIDVDGNEYIKGTDDINIEQGKLKGVRFTGSNGNSIFIPAAGYCDESSLDVIGMSGKLWSSSLFYGSDVYVSYLNFYYDGSVHEFGNDRYYGHSVRGVLKQ
jgi:hypothetical protein